MGFLLRGFGPEHTFLEIAKWISRCVDVYDNYPRIMGYRLAYYSSTHGVKKTQIKLEFRQEFITVVLMGRLQNNNNR